ncbi:flagellar protein FliS [Natranaerovirga pectinivora]|uniref:Flagellar protein FliS n=1 Tax=Natranaerovirga pectinivora TaxID=682400 RepID=A0A4R3MEZ4_9FIRM|nr:flagellar protein FliS [Natranaerovirga pectinivora]TCT11623.1 flagellar protein FliS [Natranaerovirga pectinivora]
MIKERIKEYNSRVIQASKGELIVITYELIIDFLNEAKEAKLENNKDQFDESIKSAQRTLRTLIESLDFGFDISKNLMSLYIFVNKQLLQSLIKYSSDEIESAQKVISTLLISWKEAATTVNADPLIDNAQQLYAGLTYGKGILNETILGDNNSRGFKA